MIRQSAVIGFFIAMGTCFIYAEPDRLVIYDLRYALKVDASRPGEAANAWDHCHAISSLQGIVNRNQPSLYVMFVDSQIIPGENVDEYWLDKYRQQGQWLSGRGITTISSVEELVGHFRELIKGAVVYDPKVPSTSNAASAVAGAEDLIAIRYDPLKGSLYDRLIVKGPKLDVKVWLINPDGTSKFTGSGLIPNSKRNSTGSAKCDAYEWMKENYIDKGLCDCTHAGYYIDYYWVQKPTASILNHHTLTNHDYFVSKKGFFFDLSPWADEPATDDPTQRSGTDRQILQELLLSAYKQTAGREIIHIGGFPPWAFKYTKHAGGGHEDVPAEWEYTAIISAYNAFQDADAIGFGAMANASFWQHFPLKDRYPQKWVTPEELKKRGYLTEDGQVDFKGRDFIIFYVGDYDSASWVYQRTMDIWDDPNRGKIPLMWCISPIIDKRAPMAMDYIRRTATPNDYFAAADNGAGYLNPGMLRDSGTHRPISNLPGDLSVWRDHCSKYYQKWGLTISGFLIDGYAEGMGGPELDCYETFSPNGVVWQKGAISYLHHNLPVLRSDWDINDGDPAAAARKVVQRVKDRPIPFHWFRNILKTPSWYVDVHERIKSMNPKIELLDAPTFFELYRIYLKQNPEAAAGK
ncbi:MAG: hypothetical protein JXB18_01940 [Sedimentisphaerales bacterium]|nr:hypothetical protein [Sedimentisphaerales bacterium]